MGSSTPPAGGVTQLRAALSPLLDVEDAKDMLETQDFQHFLA